MSQSVDLRALEELEQHLKGVLNELPGARRELHQEYAVLAKELVDQNIRATVNDSHGKIQRWQESRVGSGGGYAAVSPQKGETGRDSPGAITNYLESGHRIRRPSGQDPDYVPRINVSGRVDGRHFYHAANQQIQLRAIEVAERFAADLADKLEGK